MLKTRLNSARRRCPSAAHMGVLLPKVHLFLRSPDSQVAKCFCRMKPQNSYRMVYVTQHKHVPDKRRWDKTRNLQSGYSKEILLISSFIIKDQQGLQFTATCNIHCPPERREGTNKNTSKWQLYFFTYAVTC